MFVCPCNFVRNSLALLRLHESYSALSSSVPSEQAFSRAGRVVDNKRARLGDESIQILMELESWNRFLN